jgi:Tripartite tricarboxylate transporter TctB family
MTPNINKADAIAGLLFIAIGAVFGLKSLGMELGTPLRMGPGYFPLVLACALIILGGFIVASSFKSVSEELSAHAWRGIAFIVPAPIFFGLTVRGLGFVPSIFLTTLIAAMASVRMKILPALLLSAGVAVFCTLVFSYGLGLPFRRFGPWLGF